MACTQFLSLFLLIICVLDTQITQVSSSEQSALSSDDDSDEGVLNTLVRSLVVTISDYLCVRIIIYVCYLMRVNQQGQSCCSKNARPWGQTEDES